MASKRKPHTWGDEPGVAQRSGFDASRASGWSASTRSTFAEPSRHGDRRSRRSRRRPGWIGLSIVIVALMLVSYLAVLALWPLIR